MQLIDWSTRHNPAADVMLDEFNRVQSHSPAVNSGDGAAPSHVSEEKMDGFAQILDDLFVAFRTRALANFEIEPGPNNYSPLPDVGFLTTAQRAITRSRSSRRIARATTGAEAAKEEALQEVKALRAERARLANTTLQGTYESVQIEENGSANNFRRAAMALVLLAVVAGFAVGALVPSESAVESAVHQVAAAAVVLGLAGYCAKQSAHHRNVAVWAKVTAVHLKTFDDFIAPIESPTLREAIRQQFASKLYGSMPSESAQAPETASSDITWMQHLITTMAAEKR